jgi:hypothetical protein
VILFSLLNGKLNFFQIKVLFVCVFLSLNLSKVYAFELGVGVRTMGPFIEVGQKLGNSFNLRIASASEYEFGDIKYSSSDKIEVESVFSRDFGQWNLAHSSLLIDYHPFKANLRLTVGMADSLLSWSVKNTNADIYTFGGKQTSPDVVDSTELSVQFTNGLSPYVGLGWASGFDKEKGFSFNGDIGVLGVSDFVILFDASCIGIHVDSEVCKEVKQNAKEELNILRSEEKINLLPLLGLGVSYKF